MPNRRHSSWVTANPAFVRPCMNDLLTTVPPVYDVGVDFLKPGEGHMNEEYTRYNHNHYDPGMPEQVRQFYMDTHSMPQSIYTNRYRPGRQ